MKLKEKISYLLSVVMLTACQQQLDFASKNSLAQDSREISDTDREEGDISSEPTQIASEPVMVGGAYLACAYLVNREQVRCDYPNYDGSVATIPGTSNIDVYRYFDGQKAEQLAKISIESPQNYFEFKVSSDKNLTEPIYAEVLLNGKLIRADSASINRDNIVSIESITISVSSPINETMNNVVLKQAEFCSQGFKANSYCFYYSGLGESCSTSCSSRGGVNIAGTSWANSTAANCDSVFTGLKAPTFGRGVRSISLATAQSLNAGGFTGCSIETSESNGAGVASGRWIVTGIPNNYPFANGSEATAHRACACNN